MTQQYRYVRLSKCSLNVTIYTMVKETHNLTDKIQSLGNSKFDCKVRKILVQRLEDTRTAIQELEYETYDQAYKDGLLEGIRG